MHFFETELQLKSIENWLDAPKYLEEGGYSSAAYRHGIHLLFDFFPAGTLYKRQHNWSYFRLSK